jgi:hypothetical protein
VESCLAFLVARGLPFNLEAAVERLPLKGWIVDAATV